MMYRAIIGFEFKTDDDPAQILREFSKLISEKSPSSVTDVKVQHEVVEEAEYKDITDKLMQG